MENIFSKIKGIIFDYGGTIDSNGLHWAEVIWKAYLFYDVPVGKDDFRNAFVYGERTMGKNPLVKPEHNFRDMLHIKIDLQINWLYEQGLLPEGCNALQRKNDIADWCYEYAHSHIETARPVLEKLSEKYPMVLVSNFYGNISSVLKDFGIDHLFPVIVESAVVGIRKPDPAIFRIGLDKLALNGEDVVVIGDSYDKDIVPAQSLGCRTVWIKNIGWNPYSGTETADAVITEFESLSELFGL